MAKETHKPLMVVFRCIPCEACQEFDDDVARRDPVIRDLLDKFICVRIVQANTMDLSHFQFDYDLSFAVFFLNTDLTIYGRFGTRSNRLESDDISLAGLRAAMAEALANAPKRSGHQGVAGGQASQADAVQDAEGLSLSFPAVISLTRLRRERGAKLHSLPSDPRCGATRPTHRPVSRCPTKSCFPIPTLTLWD